MIDKAIVDLKLTGVDQDPRRLRNRAIHTIRTHMKKTGDYWMPLRRFYSFLSVSEIGPSWPCVCREGFVSLAKYAHIEDFLKTTFARIRTRATPAPLVTPETPPFLLDEVQRDAVKQACCHPLFILSGGAGVGKTTVCEHIVQALGKTKVTCAAPTGKAAQRLQELVGIPTFTVHRLVYMSETIDVAPILLLDEQSMQEPEILARLLLKRTFTKIIFVGDVGQLTSVGPGQFFRDLCESDIPQVELTHIYRSDSFVASNGQKVRAGDWDLDTDDDSFEICRYEDQPQLIETCKGIYEQTKTMPIVLCNTNAEVAELNYDLREICNPIGAKPRTKPVNLDYISANLWRYPQWSFGQGDTVINIRNYYVQEDGKKGDGGNVVVLKVANGEIGVVTAVGPLTVSFFGGSIEFNLMEEANDYLRPAYALTVNKAQGSEYDTVIVKARTAWGDQRERFYTAITRAKKKCIVFEVGNAIEDCVRAPVAKRQTFLLK
jgi:exodeoxyribonuclease V alpha subunit